MSSSRHQLGTEANYSASVRAGDLDGDGDMDLIVANGRHWPQQNLIFLNDGRGQFPQVRELGSDRSTSYACEVVDLDADGDLDIVTGNAMAPCQVFLNEGAARFVASSQLSEISSVRSLTLADIDSDQDVDILMTCRKRPNAIFLNSGSGQFSTAKYFGTSQDSTIDVLTADFNRDERPDLVLANRDGQPNAVLLQRTDTLEFETHRLGAETADTRAVVVADWNGDGLLDCAMGNIGAANQIWFGNGDGSFSVGPSFGSPDRMTYALSAGDMDGDGDQDLVAAHVGAANEVYFNQGSGDAFRTVEFGAAETATYGLCLADFDGDNFLDIAVANSGALNRVFLNRPALNQSPTASTSQSSGTQPSGTSSGRDLPAPNKSVVDATMGQSKTTLGRPKSPGDWPMFRGTGSRGISDGFQLPETWSLDESGEAENDSKVLWKTPIPGLAHSSPIVVGDRLFLATCIAQDGEAPLQVGRSGAPTAAEDHGQQEWVVYSLDKSTGFENWRRTVHSGVPKATRHAKATHANSTLAVSDDRLVAFFGSEGLHCYDLDGNPLWKRDLGTVNISKYGIGWGYASSPAIHQGRIVLVCDDPDDPYLVALRLKDGKELWRRSRKNDCERNWSTPLILEDSTGVTQVVVNGWPNVVSYDLKDGSELWRIEGGGDNPVPTPFLAHDYIFISSAHGSLAPIHAVHPTARGNLTDEIQAAQVQADEIVRSTETRPVLWSVSKGGCYMSTPVVYGDYLYLGNSNGVLRCFHALSGEKAYEVRLTSGGGIIASLVAGDGKIYCASEDGNLYVVRAGAQFELLAKNDMGHPCFASPAISGNTLFVRTTRQLIAIASQEE